MGARSSPMLAAMYALALTLLVQLAPAQAPTTAAEPAPTTATPTEVTPPASPTTTELAPATTPAEAPPEKASLLPPKTQPRLLVIDIADKGAGADVTNAVNQALQQQAVVSHRGEAITATQIKLLLDAQATQQLLGCDSEACMTQIGALVEADLIMGGNVTRVGDDVVITVLTVDPKDGRRVKQEQRKTPLNKDLYYYAAKQLSSLVLTGKAADPRVPVVVQVMAGGVAAEGTIIVDGQERGLSSSAQLDLDPGAHEVIVKRPGFATWRTLLDVVEGTPQQVTATLVAERLQLWPVAIATGAGALVTGVASLLMLDVAAAEYSGQGVLFKAGNGAYQTVAPTDSADLCQREETIWFYGGRTPAEGEAPFAANGCGVVAGPGVGGWLGITSMALLTVTGALLTTDLILTATAE
jgi:hypothetical protein